MIAVLLRTGLSDPLNYQVHLANLVLTLIDCWYTAHPVRLLHFWIVQIYGAAYLLWTYINYAVCFNIYIYHLLHVA
jgi:hypothetical protein